ncbi:hypothetical protein [Actinophytocola sp.]|uniref:hypothetical protein n=1 Tax=Actinophytocola sp. TaxID=1872138 RepID=UPI002D801210|nr:hypothetical protein [Actinophytocola sp.]HET9139535.1 hypothetical protein [Actinophytocola sp.]
MYTLSAVRVTKVSDSREPATSAPATAGGGEAQTHEDITAANPASAANRNRTAARRGSRRHPLTNLTWTVIGRADQGLRDRELLDIGMSHLGRPAASCWYDT